MEMMTGVSLLIILATMCSALPAVDEKRLELSRHRRNAGYQFYYPNDNLCCPKVLPATGEIEHSAVEAFGTCQVQVAAITASGTCNHTHEGFWWFVDWGNGEYDEGCTSHLGPFGPRVHQYQSCIDAHAKGYEGTEECVTVYYCSSPDSRWNTCTYNADCCDYFFKCIKVPFEEKATDSPY